MGRSERVTLALLVATAGLAYSLIPRVLPAPKALPGGGLGLGLGRSVAPDFVVPGAPHRAAVPHATQTPARVAAAPVAPVVRVVTPRASTPSAIPSPNPP